jgi:hypothetical protein
LQVVLTTHVSKQLISNFHTINEEQKLAGN